MPKSSRLLWLSAVLLALFVYPLILYSGHLYYAEGGRSPDAPGMLFASILFTTPIWLSAWMMFVAIFLVGYRGGGRLADLHAPSIASGLLSFVAFSVTIFVIWALFARTQWWLWTRLPFTAWHVAGAVFVQYLRAAAVQRSKMRSAGPR